ncbi:MAG: adenylyltransferase/cytidyltransferase family protein [Phycisphaeraceae bacterium]|nr:adenylyltransferase/cytidyltransferase family protein [Phycisphaeraceae bacterium]
MIATDGRITTERKADDGAAGKVLELPALTQRLAQMRQGRRVVHCHGVFDLLHVGHIKHLQQARELGDLLVVTITPDRFVNKGPSRPAFPERLRAEALAALACVDYVAVNHWPRATETIQALRPDVFVKGGEFKELKDHNGAVAEEERAVRAVGGVMAFTDGITFSSSTLINQHLSTFPPEVQEYLRGFGRRHPIDGVLNYLQSPGVSRVVVVGEAIIDEYHYCDAIGKSSKEPMLAVRQQSVETFAGGTLAVANHFAPFCERVDLVAAMGKACPRQGWARERLMPQVLAHFVETAGAPTIVKRRFVDRYFFQKLFAVYEMNDAPLSGGAEDELVASLEQVIPGADMVVVVDYGHGLLTPRAIDVICQRSKLLVVNAQSNAGNQGYHSIGRYPRADWACLAENEIRLEARDRYGDLQPMAEHLADRLEAQGVIVTRGSKGSLLFGRSDGFVEVPAVAGQVKDRMGAGDTLLAVASLCLAAGAPLEVVGLLGNAAGAEAVATIGHQRTIEKGALLKHVECLLK